MPHYGPSKPAKVKTCNNNPGVKNYCVCAPVVSSDSRRSDMAAKQYTPDLGEKKLR